MAKNNRGPMQFYQAEIPAISIGFDTDAFNAAIRSHGCRLIHQEALRCPVGMISLDDSRRDHPHHENCSNGFLFEDKGYITALMTSNSSRQDSKDVGFVDSATMAATFPQTYDCSESQFSPAVFDRFYLAEEAITVVTWELQQVNGSGMERLNFPIVCVDRLVDFRGQVYKQGDDFTIIKGQVSWVEGAHHPEVGAVFSIRYRYRPYWYLSSFGHEIRTANVDNPMTTERTVVRMPIQASLKREWLFKNEEQDSESKNPNSPRQESSPDDGGFGGR